VHPSARKTGRGTVWCYFKLKKTKRKTEVNPSALLSARGRGNHYAHCSCGMRADRSRGLISGPLRERRVAGDCSVVFCCSYFSLLYFFVRLPRDGALLKRAAAAPLPDRHRHPTGIGGGRATDATILGPFRLTFP